MSIFVNFLRVLFMLSTIVYVTDCCSSRILLLKEHTLKYVRQTQYHQTHLIHEHAASTQLQQKLPQHVDIVANNVREYNHNFSSEMHGSSEHERDPEEGDNNAKSEPYIGENSEITDSPIQNSDLELVAQSETVVEQTLIVLNSTEKSAIFESINQTLSNINFSDFITDPAIRQAHAGNPTYHVIDFYYTIMRDVLSFECNGQFITDFCLNGGRCFRYPIGNHSFVSCECADGFVGERCESKNINGLYTTSSEELAKNSAQPKILMARFIITFPLLIVFSVAYILIAAILVFKCPKKRLAETLDST